MLWFVVGLRRFRLVGITHDYSFRISALITKRLKVLVSSFDPNIR